MKTKKQEKKSEFSFGGILTKSVNEFKTNFKEILKFVFLFVGIPAIILILTQIIFLIVDPNVFSIMSNPDLLAEVNEGTRDMPLYYDLTHAGFTILSAFLTLLVSVGLMSTSLKKSKFSLKELIENGKSVYWKFFGFSVVIGIFVLLLTLLLIIPGIIFGIYWIFAAYVFLDKKESIKGSLKKSKAIVKGRWWKTFGYYLLLSLILIGFIILLTIVTLPSAIAVIISLANGSNLSLGVLIIDSIFSLVYSFLISLITLPLSVLFMKHFYFAMKKQK